jgi:hypothetical protein
VTGSIFVSYSRQDMDYAHRLIDHLQTAGLSIWFDRDIRVGQRWDRTVRAQIDECAVFLLLMSPAAEESDWVAAEVDLARKRRKPIVPVLLSGEVFFGFTRTQYFNVTDGSMPDRAFLGLLADLVADSEDHPTRMPDPVATATSREYRRSRLELRRAYEALAESLAALPATPDPRFGVALEIDLVDRDGSPVMGNAEVVDAVGDPQVKTEMGQFTFEVHVAPALPDERCFDQIEVDLKRRLGAAQAAAARIGARLVLIGILPTVTLDHLTPDHMSTDPRFRALDVFFASERQGDVLIDIQGQERLRIRAGSIMLEAMATSAQLWLEVSPDNYASHWNAAQMISGVQAAVAANSPFLLQHCLWEETRTALIEQAVDARPPVLDVPDRRPRAWFGERWMSSIQDHIDENLRYYPPMHPADERLHNLRIYRWNRLLFGEQDHPTAPRLRIQHRVLPCGPTVTDTLANIAFSLGLVRRLAVDGTPLWTNLPFVAAEQNFYKGCRYGLEASFEWPGRREVPVVGLVLDRLLPLAAEGLDLVGIAATSRDRLLGVIERRCVSGQTGAVWQRSVVRTLEANGHDRPSALRRMTTRYAELSLTDLPVHEWPL